MFFIYYVWFLFRFFFDFFNYVISKLNLNNFLKFYIFRNIEEFGKLFRFLRIMFDTSDKRFLKIYKSYPIIFFFKLYSNKTEYTNLNLKFLVKQYNYFYNILKLKNGNFLKLKFNFVNLNNYFFLLYLVFQSFFIKKYYNLYSFLFFDTFKLNNLVKLNWVFFFIIPDFKKLLILFDINKMDDWYKLNFSLKPEVTKIKNYTVNFWTNREYKRLKKAKHDYFLKVYKIYNSNYFKKNLVNFMKTKYKSILYASFKNLYLFKFKLSNNLVSEYFLSKYPIRFSESSVNKYINLKNLNSYNFFFLRKNRIFNKSRYSRNRQLYRTGVYWCLWLNIIIVYGLFFLFYRFTFNFGYVWIGIFILMLSFIFSKVLKYNFVNLKVLLNEFLNLFKWFSILYINFLNFLKLIFKKYVINLNLINYLYNFINVDIKNKFFFIQLSSFNIKLIKNIINFFKKLDLLHFTILWQEMHEKDTSFLRYKTVIHFFKQLTQIHKMV